MSLSPLAARVRYQLMALRTAEYSPRTFTRYDIAAIMPEDAEIEVLCAIDELRLHGYLRTAARTGEFDRYFLHI